MIKLNKKLFLLLFFLLAGYGITQNVRAQASDPDPDNFGASDQSSYDAGVNDPGGGGGNPDEPAPIDGGLTLLLATGVGYGVKKWRDARKKQSGN